MEKSFSKFTILTGLTLILVLLIYATKPAYSQEIKWYPGHYVFVSKRTDMPGILNDIKARPIVRGIQISYYWDELEPEKDDFNFLAVHEDMNLLKQQGKFLIIQVQYKSFFANNPRIPEYLKSSEYDGGAYPGDNGKNWNICLWNDNVRDRLITLLTALGKEYDSNETLVAINLPESVLSKPYSDSPFFANWNYYSSVFNTRINLLSESMRTLFPTTPFVQYFNSGTSEANKHEVVAREHGIGIGGPDTWVGAYKFDAFSRYAYNYAKRMAGLVPIMHSVQWPNFHSQTAAGRNSVPPLHPHDNINNPIPALFAFNRDTLKTNFISWNKRNEFPSPEATKTYWTLVKELWDSLSIAYPNDPAGSMNNVLPELLVPSGTSRNSIPTDKVAEIGFHPNPNSSGILKLNKAADIVIYNLTGQLLKTSGNTDEINIAGLDNGVYIVKDVNGAGRILVKQ